MLIGFVTGGRDPGVRNVAMLGTAQRNVSAALVVTLQNFTGTDAVPFVLVASILLPLLLIPTARMLGRRTAAGTPAPMGRPEAAPAP
jgi:BASS family bile acid:Na+ symporter